MPVLERPVRESAGQSCAIGIGTTSSPVCSPATPPVLNTPSTVNGPAPRCGRGSGAARALPVDTANRDPPSAGVLQRRAGAGMADGLRGSWYSVWLVVRLW